MRWRPVVVVNPHHAGAPYVSHDMMTTQKTAYRLILVMLWGRSMQSAYSDCMSSSITQWICSDAGRWQVASDGPQDFQYILTQYVGQWLQRCYCCSPPGILKY